MKVYSNGDLVNKDQISEVFEPGFLFGWGVFEPLRTYKGNIPFLSQHIQRLKKAVELLGIGKLELDWKKTIKDLLAENSLGDAYIRITAYKKRKGTGLLIYTDKFGYYTDEVYEKGFTAMVSPYRRCAKNICSQVKSLSYLQNRFSWLKAQEAKKSEALILNPKDNLAGGSRSNLFLVKDKKLFTPLIEDGAFCGITRRAVIDIAKESGLNLEEKELKIEDVLTSDEAFLTSALMEVMPLVETEDKKIGQGTPGPITSKILSEYRKKLK